MPADMKSRIAEQYKGIVAAQTTMLPTWLAELTNPLGNWSNR